MSKSDNDLPYMILIRVLVPRYKREVFVIWLRRLPAASITPQVPDCNTQVLPSMSPFPFPNSVLVMNNCRIHKNPRILKYAAAGSIRLLYLPSYSPDLMPIEEAFSVYKTWIRRQGDEIQAYCGHP